MRALPTRSLFRVLACLLAGACLAGAAPASTTPASAAATYATAGNPLAGRPWGTYLGPADQAWQPYMDATGTEKKILGYITLMPKAKWFGDWIPNDQITAKVQAYIANAQAGNPDTLVQMAVFRMQPWEHDACKRLPTTAEQASYKEWIDNFAKGIGDAHVAIIQQPDGPFALCAPHASTLPSELVAYGTRKLSSPANSSVYVEVGADDWPHAGAQGGVDAAVKIAIRGGVKYARGIALNGTHYSSTSAEIGRGAAVVRALAAKGITGKHVVINTAESGHPFVFGDYTGSDPDNAFVCSTKHDPAARTCVTLGLPPSANATDARLHLSATRTLQARKYVDGYIWFGRPWLYRQADPFVKSRALQLVRTSPFSPFS